MASAEDRALLDLIYGAAADVSLWSSVVERFTVLFGGSLGYLTALDVVTGQGEIIAPRLEESVWTVYEQHYAALNPINNVQDPARFLKDWDTRVITDADSMPREEYIRTEYYNDFALPNESDTTLMLRLGRLGSKTQVLNISRSLRCGPFSGAEFELAVALHPHLIRAAAISRQIGTNRALEAETGLVFQSSSTPMFLVAAQGGVLRINTAGEALLRRRSDLRAVGSKLRAKRPDDARKLEGLIAAAGSDDVELRTGGSMTIAESGPSGGLIVHVTPLRRAGRPMFDGPPCVMVCVVDSEAHGSIPEASLRDFFGLTAAEVRVVRSLLRTGDLPRASAELGISPHTAKVHLSRVYEKTGVDRQILLARLVLRCAESEAVLAGETGNATV